MNTPLLKKFCLAMLSLFVSGNLFAQKIVRFESPDLATAEDEANASNGVIFSNLGPTATDEYNSETFAAIKIAGKSVIGLPETWAAINFIPKRDVQARVLLAAITYVSGTKLVNLGLYTDNEGEVGDPIPAGQGSATQIPPNGECCQLTKVTLQGSGVTLSGGIRYWLVASPDNVRGATFSGSWQTSHEGDLAQGAPPPGQWSTGPSLWPAAEVRGAPVDGSARGAETAFDRRRAGRITIFSNLGPTATDLFDNVAVAAVAGKSSADGSEVWVGLPFIPKVNCHAKTLAAAIQYLSGDMKVNLGIYSDNDGTVGTVLPNGEASTTSIPAYLSCCDLTKVVLPGPGVALTAKTRFWLVASTDDINAPTFEGFWMEANIYSNYQEPKFFSWTFLPSYWLAAEIRGTSP